MERETGGRFKREGIYAYLWLTDVEVRQKTKKNLKSNYPSTKKVNKKIIKQNVVYSSIRILVNKRNEALIHTTTLMDLKNSSVK